MKTFDPTYRVKRLDGETFRWVDDPCEAAIMRLYAYGKSLAFKGHSDELVEMN